MLGKDKKIIGFGHDNCQLMMKLGEKEAQAHWEELMKVKKSTALKLRTRDR